MSSILVPKGLQNPATGSCRLGIRTPMMNMSSMDDKRYLQEITEVVEIDLLISFLQNARNA